MTDLDQLKALALRDCETLSNRTVNTLAHNGLLTVGQLLDYRQNLVLLSGLGRKGLSEVRDLRSEVEEIEARARAHPVTVGDADRIIAVLERIAALLAAVLERRIMQKGDGASNDLASS